jgi:uncharacterized membrane protein
MRTTLSTGRFEAFSDGVFAIAITLLVLEISVPPDSGSDLLGAILDQWPTYLAYLVSFVTIGVTWVEHAAITHHLHGVDSTLVRLNLLLLLLVSFLPFPTGLVAEHIREEDAERVATTILGINLLLVALVVSTLWRYAVRSRLVGPDTEEEEIRRLTQRLTPSLAGYVVLILLALFFPVVAVVGYLLIALLLILPIGLRSGEQQGA